MNELEFNIYCNKVVELIEAHEDITHVYMKRILIQERMLLRLKN